MGKKRFKEKKYLKHHGNICPYCESHNINAKGRALFDDNYVSEDVECNSCESEWCDTYILTTAEEISNNT